MILMGIFFIITMCCMMATWYIYGKMAGYREGSDMAVQKMKQCIAEEMQKNLYGRMGECNPFRREHEFRQGDQERKGVEKEV